MVSPERGIILISLSPGAMKVEQGAESEEFEDVVFIPPVMFLPPKIGNSSSKRQPERGGGKNHQMKT